MLSKALSLRFNSLWFGVLEFLVTFISEFVLWAWNPVEQWSTSQEFKMKVLVTQSCPTLCDPMDCSPPGSSVRGILQQEYLSGLPLPSPGDLPDPRFEPGSPTLQTESVLSESPSSAPFHVTSLLWSVLELEKHFQTQSISEGRFTKSKKER